MRRLPLILVMMLCAMPLAAQQPDPALEQVQAEAKKATEAYREFERAGGKRGSPDHPGRAAAKQLWKFRGKHPGTAAAKLATVEALHLLNRASDVAELRRLMATLPSDDPAWDDLISVVREAAADAEHGAFFLQKAEEQLARSTEPERRARMHLALGRIHSVAGRSDVARQNFQHAAAVSPGSRFGQAARDELYDLDVLVIGRTAPDFSATTTGGDAISNETLKGKVAVFVYWASW